MTPKEIEDGNRLIATFMGGKFQEELNAPWKFDVQPSKYLRPDARIKELLYHSDWNWIMNVATKIKSLPLKEVVRPAGEATHSVMPYTNATNPMREGMIKADIDKTWAGVVSFIKWYNAPNE